MRWSRCKAQPTATPLLKASWTPCRDGRRRGLCVNKQSQTEPAITPQIVAEHGLTPEEYERVLKIMGRVPNMTELGIFSVMWSEHCSYKSSRRWLKRLPTS